MGDSELLGRGKLINKVAQVERRGQRKGLGLVSPRGVDLVRGASLGEADTRLSRGGNDGSHNGGLTT